jgi:MFS family permease
MDANRKNIRIVAWVRILFAALFCIPVITLYWKKFGLDLLDIFWLQAIFSVSVLVFEIPTGFIGDRLGRKKTLLLSTGIAATGWIFYSFAHTFPQFVFAEVYLGLAFGFLSGTDTALVYESLLELKAAESFTKVEGKQYAGNHWGEAFAALTGGVLAGWLPLELTFVLTGFAALIAFGLCLGIHEPPRQTAGHPRGTWYGLYKIARFVFIKSKVVRWVIPLMAACGLSTMLGVWLYQPCWQEKQVPIWLFGALWAALSLPAGLASHYAHVWEKKLGAARILWLLPLPAVLGYVCLAWAPGYWALAGAYSVTLLRGLTFPILGKYIHEETFSDKRATVMSIQSWLFRLSYFILGPGIGWLGKHYGLSAAFAASAVVSLAGIAVFIPGVVRCLEEKCAEPAVGE